MFSKNQCTIQWYVDDLKISCQYESIIDSVQAKLSAHYGKIALLTVTWGIVHDYLGMRTHFSTKEKAFINMYDYINGVIDSMSDDMCRTAATQPQSHLFKVDKINTNKTDTGTADLFHYYIAKLLFFSKCSRPDIQTAVAFICTRVQEPDTDNYNKLVCVMKYL